MKSVRVDLAVKRPARGGLTWGEFNRETQAFGLATTGGRRLHNGIAGLTLGGGLGWMMGKARLSCDNLISADIVTADGQFLTASAERNPDLFWGLRGGGGNFASSPRSSTGCIPVAQVLAGMVVHPMDKAGEVLRFYRDFCRSCPDEMLAAAALMTTHRGHAGRRHRRQLYRGHRRGRKTDGSASEIRLASGRITIAPTSYVALNALFDAAVAVRRHPTLLEVELPEGTGRRPDRDPGGALGQISLSMSMVMFFHLHGAAVRVDRDATAFGLRDDQWDYDVISQWTDPAEAADHIKWTREFLDRGGAVLDRRGIRQPPRRGGIHAHQGRLQSQLRSARA